MSNIYTFRKPLDVMRQLASALTVRNCIVSGSGTDAECSAYVWSEIVPPVFRRICLQDFRNVDSMISSLAPYFFDSDGERWTMQRLESACHASEILPMAIQSPLPAEWIQQRFDMVSRLNIAGGGVMTTGIDGYGESDVSYEMALSSAIADAGSYEDFKASRCLVFDKIGSTYCASATLTVSGSALSPMETPIWGNPRKVFRLSAFQGVHDRFYAGEIVTAGGTMTVAEGVNAFEGGTYSFADPVYHATEEHEEAGMEEFWDDSAPVFLDYT